MKKRKYILILTIITMTIFIIYFIYVNLFSTPYITNIEKNESKQFKDKVIINIYVKNLPLKINKNIWCSITKKDDNNSNKDWIQANNGYCNFTVSDDDYTYYVKDNKNHITDAYNQTIKLNKVLSINAKDNYYMYKGMEQRLEYSIDAIGLINDDIQILDYDKKIINIENNSIKAINYGSTKITLKIGNISKNINIIVSNLIRKPEIDTTKEYVKCGQFSKEDNDLLDNILEERIQEVGTQTRAGVVTAARFLALEFNYRIHYFYENGRLENYPPYYYVDGEGRYYHKGLFLNDSRINNLKSSLVGPAIWGCNLTNFTNWGPYVSGNKYPNGFDCSGFITWALLNGGFDPGDIGAGVDDNHKDATDLGEKINISDELMNSGKVKVGDLIGLDGHIAILAGIDENNYYIAESLNTTGGVVITTVNKSKLVNNSIYKYIILMDNFYKKDGKLTNMW